MQKQNNNGFGFAVCYLENILHLSQYFPNPSEAFRRFWAFNTNGSSSQETEELSTYQDLAWFEFQNSRVGEVVCLFFFFFPYFFFLSSNRE